MISLGANIPMNSFNTMRVTYSFDLTLSRLRSASIGSHEVSLIFDFDKQKLFGGLQTRNKNRRKYKCPTDFRGYN
jgi:hypothetical protein